MILVTGGLGFIGSHLCNSLVARGEKVVAFDNAGTEQAAFLKRVRAGDAWDDWVTLVSGDLLDYSLVSETLRNHRVERVIHTAAMSFIPETIRKPVQTFRVNTEGTLHLLEACRLAGVRKFVYISTSSVYGDLQRIPADEQHPIEPKDIYGATKAAADRIAISYHRTYRLPVTVVRTSSVYGPGDLENRVAKMFLENGLQGKPIELQGGGTQRRDFSYVKDVARGILAALDSERAVGETFNITGGQDHSIADLAEVLRRFFPDLQVRVSGSREVDTNRGRMDISKAQRILGYAPEYTLEEGVRDYLKWYRDFYAPLTGLSVQCPPVL